MFKTLIRTGWVCFFVALIYTHTPAQVQLFPSSEGEIKEVKIQYNPANTYQFFLYQLDQNIPYFIAVLPFNSADNVQFRIDQRNHEFFRKDGNRLTTVDDGLNVQIQDLLIDFQYLPIEIQYGTNYQLEEKSFNLIVSSEKEGGFYYNIIIEKPGTSAEIQLENSRVLYIDTWSLRRRASATFETYINDVDLNDRLNGVYTYFKEFDGVPGYDPVGSSIFRINGDTIHGFWGLPEEADLRRNVDLGEKKKVEIDMSGLGPGSYQTKIGFNALNAKDATDKEYNMEAKVRHVIWYPIIVILLSIMFSAAMNVWVKNRRERVSIKRQLIGLDRAWLKEVPSTGSISVLSSISLIDKLSKRFFISSSDTIQHALASIPKLINFLRQIRQLKKKIDLKGNDLKRNRALKYLDRINAMVGEYELTEVREKEIDAAIKHLQSWFESESMFDAKYEEDLKFDINRLNIRVDIQRFPRYDRPYIIKLRDNMMDDSKDALEREDSYSALKIFWKRIDYKESHLRNLIAHYRDRGLRSLFREVDILAFKEIRESKEDIFLKSPADYDELESFVPINFQLGFKTKDGLENSFLFKYGLRYSWKIEITYKVPDRSKLSKWFSSEEKSYTLIPVTEKPRVIQYAPRSCKMKVSCTIKHATEGSFNVPCAAEAGGEAKAVSKIFDVGSSLTFSMDKSLQTTQYVATIGATIVAIVMGLVTYYLDNPTFGTTKDYLSLFLIAAGIDQGKNFLTRLNAYSDRS